MGKIVNFILGRAGSGKSTKISDIIFNKINSGVEKIIIIVPEQISFEKERYMLEFLGNKNFDKIKVLSFSRLSDFVSSTLKIPYLEQSSDISQIVMINEAIEAVKPELKMYLKSSGDINLAQLILNTIHDFKSNKIDEKILQKIYDLCKKDILKQKIKEIISIYNSYKNICKNKLSDAMDTLSILEGIIKSSEIFEGYTVFFDDFTNFTSQQFSVLEEIIKQSEEVYFSFCADKVNLDFSESNLFLPCNKTISKIKKIAVDNFINIQNINLSENNLKFKNKELKFLEKNIFRTKKEIFKETPENILIYHAFDLTDESEFVAREIQRLVIEGKYRYKDFAVLTHDITSYQVYLKSAFSRFNVPCFFDMPEKLFNKNLTNLILSAFDIIHNKFSLEDILSYLKTGLVGFSAEEISIFENYILLWNIKPEAWENEFSFHPKGYYKEFEEEDIENLKKINSLRKKFLEPIKKFSKKIKYSSGKRICTAIYELLVDVNAAENLKVFCENLEKFQNYQTAEKHAIIWDTIMEVLNQIANIIADKKLSSKKFLEILNLALNFVDFSYVPQSVDSVIVASVDRTHVSDVKVVFIIGTVNGEFPKIPTSSDIFTDQEINHISSFGIEIKDDSNSFIVKERFLAYCSVSSPSERLYLSFPSSDSFKKSKFPSEIIKEVKDIFPKIKIFSKENFSFEDLILSKTTAFEVYSKTKYFSSNLNFTLENFLIQDEKFKEKCEAIENFKNKNRLNFKNSSNALKLFGEKVKLSASQIEKYYTCRFAYFCQYFLKAKEQQTTSFGVMDYGTLIHYLFEKLFKNHKDDENKNLEDSLLENEVLTLLKNYIDEKLGGFENKPKIFFYRIEKLKKSVIFLFKYILSQFKDSNFKMLGAEVEISQKSSVKPLEILLSNGKKVLIEGKIDRVDIMKTENENFVRIVDYKTGKTKFKLSDVLYGLNMQMLIYLLTLKENGIENCKNLIPAGILYFPALKPVIETADYENKEKIESEIKKKLKMNGLVLENENVILGMEKDAKGEFIPAEISKSGEIKKSDSVIALDELEVIFKHIKRLTSLMCEDLFSGKTSAMPVFRNNNPACKWCSYHSICGYEEENFVKISSMTNKQTLEKMKEGSKCNGSQVDE